VDGVRYLPPNFPDSPRAFNVTVPQGTALLVPPFFVVGESYDNGTADDPADPIIDEIFEGTTIKSTLDGSVVLEGLTTAFPARKSGVAPFPQPIPYTNPRPVGPGVNAIASTFAAGGIWTIFDGLPVGNHTLQNEFDSDFFGQESFTYNITVVPEPAAGALAGIASVVGLGFAVRGRFRRGRNSGITYS
jgi:hypothetical protein